MSDKRRKVLCLLVWLLFSISLTLSKEKSSFITSSTFLDGGEVFAFANEEADDFLEEIELYVGELKFLPTANPKRVAVARPEIADVQSVSVDEVAIEPKAAGRTTLTIWDDFGEHLYRLNVFRENLSEVKKHVDSLIQELGLADVSTKIKPEERKVVLIGQVTELNDKERLLSALDSLKDKILDMVQLKEEEATLDIAVQVLEISRDAGKTLGFTMPTSISVSEPVGRFSSALRASMDAIFHIFDWPRANFTAKIDALIEEGKARVLSSPRLACQSGKEAELLVGGEKPIMTTQIAATGGAGTSVSYKEFGIKLKIKPTVVEGERLKVGLNIEVSEVGAAETLGDATNITARAFPLSKRTASTELFMNSGQTLGIGGLVKEKEETSVSKTAFLGDIPILGMLFRRKNTKIGGGRGESGNIELVILLTPTIVQRSLALQKKTAYKFLPPEFLKPAPQRLKKRAGNLEVELNSYIEDLRNRIISLINYPSLARESSLRGKVKLRLRILSDGQLKDVYVLQSSGSELLDSAAINTIKKLTPFPAFPSSADNNEIAIDIPIIYN